MASSTHLHPVSPASCSPTTSTPPLIFLEVPPPSADPHSFSPFFFFPQFSSQRIVTQDVWVGCLSVPPPYFPFGQRLPFLNRVFFLVLCFSSVARLKVPRLPFTQFVSLSPADLLLLHLIPFFPLFRPFFFFGLCRPRRMRVESFHGHQTLLRLSLVFTWQPWAWILRDLLILFLVLSSFRTRIKASPSMNILSIFPL